MTVEDIKSQIIDVLPRDLLIDLLDSAVARARQAHELILTTDLSGRSARGLEGQARFRLMEKGFQDACEQHGGMRLEGDIIPGTDLRYYQPFMRFGGDRPGILLGLASMSAPNEVPVKNQSRLAGVTLNYRLSPRLDLEGDGRTAKPGDIFVLLLFARDSARGGRLEEVAIGVVDSKYQSYLVYESLEALMAAYTPPPEPEATAESAPATVTLKKKAKTFRAPETPDADQTAYGAKE